MYRGTTPNLYLELETDMDLTNAQEIWVTIESQLSVLNKNLHDINVIPSKDPGFQILIVSLSQGDTLKLSPGKAKIQVRILMNNNKAYSTDIAFINVGDILREGVIEVEGESN